jgi:hypothetical protein
MLQSPNMDLTTKREKGKGGKKIPQDATVGLDFLKVCLRLW